MHTLSQRATDAYEAARHALARFAGAGRGHEVVFTSGTTESLNLVAHGLSDAGIGPAWLRPGDEIVVSALEHHANLVPWQAAARRSGARLKVLLPVAQGRVDEAGLARLLGPRTRVFALTACANATGYCPPYAELLALAARAGALTVLDAAQSASHALPAIDKLACDFMAFSSHKMYGPMGIGVLVGRRDARDKLAPLPARLEGGTPNVGGAVGIAAAADFIDGIGRDLIDTHLSNLRRAAGSRCAPATIARSRCSTTSAWGRRPGRRSGCTTRSTRSNA